MNILFFCHSILHSKKKTKTQLSEIMTDKRQNNMSKNIHQ